MKTASGIRVLYLGWAEKVREPWKAAATMGGWRIRASAHSDGAFPWQWAAPWLNRPPLFMLFGEEAGFPPRDRWPFSHKVLCLDLACSGARQQSSDDTAFGKQLPDAGVATTESTENWMTHGARNRPNRGTAPLRFDLPTSRESKKRDGGENDGA